MVCVGIRLHRTGQTIDRLIHGGEGGGSVRIRVQFRCSEPPADDLASACDGESPGGSAERLSLILDLDPFLEHIQIQDLGRWLMAVRNHVSIDRFRPLEVDIVCGTPERD